MLWRQCDPENLESQIAEVLERWGASEQIASDCADEVRGLLARVAAGALLIDAEAQERLVAFFAGYGVPAETVRLVLAAAEGKET